MKDGNVWISEPPAPVVWEESAPYKQITKQVPVKRFVGLDCETFEGLARLTCIADESGIKYDSRWAWEPDDGILGWLLRAIPKEATVGTHNMRFDAESLLKHLVMRGTDLQILVDRSRQVVREQEQDYLVSFVPKKFFTVELLDEGWRETRLQRQRFPVLESRTLFDYSQFFPNPLGGRYSLETAASKYLSEHKQTGIDSARLNIDDDYWHKNEATIQRYCYQDAYLTARLMRFAQNKIWNACEKAIGSGVSLSHPYSPAVVSQRMFRIKSKTFGKIERKEVAQAAWEAFYGGRFECRVRGETPLTSVTDMRNAYVWGLYDLPDTTGQWSIRRGETSLIESSECTFAFVKALVSVNIGENEWGPLPVRHDGELIFPNGKILGSWPLPELRAAIDHGLAHVEKVEQVTFCIEPNPRFPFYYLEDVYWERRAEKDEGTRDLLKTSALGLCGKFMQKTLKAPETASVDVYDSRTEKELHPGYLFNAPLAAYTTSRPRVKLTYEARKRNALAVMADAMILPYRCDDAGENLGEWDTKRDKETNEILCGKTRILQSGQYHIWGTPAKRRGIGGDVRSVNLFDLHGETYTTSYMRPVHLAEAVAQERGHEINIWKPSVKDHGPNQDSKRRWKIFRDFDELFSGEHVGKVLV